MDRFSKQQLKTFKKHLQNRSRRLRTTSTFREREALEQLGLQDTGELSNIRLHDADLGSVSYQQEVDLQLVEHEDEIVYSVDQALHRIEEGSFGSCTDCGEDISFRRLSMAPESEMCRACQQERETLELSFKKPNWDRGGSSYEPMIDEVQEREFG